jgi:hypothetical protein
MRAELAAYEDIPFSGTTFSMNELAEVIGAASGRPIRLASFGWWMMYLVSPFWRTGYEMLEMRYLSSLDHELAPAHLQALLPDFRATSREEVMLSEVPDHLLRPEPCQSRIAITSSDSPIRM